jgi:hypothetical protein
MYKLNISPISDTAQMPIKKGTLEFLRLSHQLDLDQILQGIIGANYNPFKFYVLWGCENSGSGSNYNISNGAVFFAGEVFEVIGAAFSVPVGQVAQFAASNSQYTIDADPVTFTDSNTYNVHDIRKYTFQAGASDGVTDYSLSLFPLKQEWTVVSGTSWLVPSGGSGTIINSAEMRYKLMGKTLFVDVFFSVANTTAPTYYTMDIPNGLSHNLPSNREYYQKINAGGSLYESYILLNPLDPTHFKLNPIQVIPDAATQIFSGQFFFEVQ